MKITNNKIDLNKENIETLVYFIFEEKSIVDRNLKIIDENMNLKITELITEKLITGKNKEINLIHNTSNKKVKKLILVGLGKKNKFNLDMLRSASGELIRFLKTKNIQDANIFLEDDFKSKPFFVIQAMVEGLILGSYEFNHFKKSKEKGLLLVKKINIASNIGRQIQTKAVKKAQIMANAVNLARDLANMPSNKLTPKIFVDQISALLSQNPKINLEIIDEEKAASLGMQAFLGVAKGSVNPPYMVVINYQGSEDNSRPSAIIGKGITFDSGGISIKPSDKMAEMKGDMTGAACVLAAIHALALLKTPKNIMAIIPLAENMPSGAAQKPGDIIKAMNGKSIEIINTDAEGRLVLIDAICFAVNNKVKEIIDIATLTGACSVALGDVASAILGNNQVMINKMLEVGKSTGEQLWQLPLYEEYLDYLSSDVADIKNCTENRLAGTSSAAKFLEQFVAKKPWIHLDIASTCFADKTSGYLIKGMTATGTRNLIEYFC
ncbi:MAG: leucyl aminopeptidase [Candidatus Margulisiibacteriota bacterium]|jgi:leucyl aminopeptidase